MNLAVKSCGVGEFCDYCEFVSFCDCEFLNACDFVHKMCLQILTASKFRLLGVKKAD